MKTTIYDVIKKLDHIKDSIEQQQLKEEIKNIQDDLQEVEDHILDQLKNIEACEGNEDEVNQSISDLTNEIEGIVFPSKNDFSSDEN